MILGLIVTVLALAILMWVVAMYIWWQKEQKVQEALATDVALEYLEKCIRLGRRGWYASEMHLRALALWGGKKMGKVFFSLFPSAEAAFTKRDSLAGLSHGPSSFFLMSISEKRKGAQKKKTEKLSV